MRLEEILALMVRSELHRYWTVTDIARLILPPIQLNQYLVLKRSDRVVAFASWAFFSEETQDAYGHATRKLMPKDWNNGSMIWLIDVIAPFGDGNPACAAVRSELRNRGHKGMRIHFKRDYGDRVRFSRVTL